MEMGIPEFLTAITLILLGHRLYLMATNYVKYREVACRKGIKSPILLTFGCSFTRQGPNLNITLPFA